MAKFILKDASLTVNNVDLSDHVSEVTVTSSFDKVDVTAMGATNKEYLLGLGDATIEVTFLQDFASSKVDQTLSALAGSNTTFTVVVKPTSGSVTSTNPSFTMTAVLPDYVPIAGKVGDASTMKVTFQNAGTTGITRATT